MKKKIIIFTGIIAIIGAMLLTQNILLKNKPTEKENITESANEKNTYRVETQASYAIDIKNKDEMYNAHEYIAIIQVNKLNKPTTYREKTNEYIKPYTSGEAKVLKVLKGDFKSQDINFLRLGGTVSYDDYLKSLHPDAREKFSDTVDKKSITYIEEKAKNDIDIENGKTYLVFMNRDDKFHNENEYTIEAFEYGLREIKMNDTTKTNINSKSILIKNNETNEYENLENAVSQKISNQFK